MRASLSLYNTGAEVDAFLEKLDRVLGEFDELDDFVPLDL